MTLLAAGLALLIGASLGLVGGGGLVGVGGGFIIVPALALVLGLPMARAVGTSLAVIAINCAAALTTAAAGLAADRVVVTAVFAALALASTLVGARMASRARPELLRRAFGLLVVGVGLYTGAAAIV